MRYTVTARRWERGWELHVADEAGELVGVTQSRTLARASVDTTVRDYIALDGLPDPEAIDVVVELDGELGERARRTRRQVREAEDALRVAAEQSRRLARDLKTSGLSGADVATVLGVSPQRVSQLLGTTPQPAAARTATR